jgi:hypothetical protein
MVLGHIPVSGLIRTWVEGNVPVQRCELGLQDHS